MGDTYLYVLIYVDDLFITGNSLLAITKFKASLSITFYMKDLRSLKYFLGIEVARNAESIYLCQGKYALDIVSEVGLTGAKPIYTPMESNHKLATSTSPFFHMPDQY